MKNLLKHIKLELEYMSIDTKAHYICAVIFLIAIAILFLKG